MGEALATIEMAPVVFDQVADTGITGDEMLISLFLRAKFARTQSEHTRKGYEGDIAKLMAAVGKPLANITASDLLQWADSLSGKAPATRARMISSVRSLFRFAQRTGYLRFNPSEIIDRPRVPITSENRYLTKDELQALLHEAKHGPRRSKHLHPAVVLMTFTAVRVSELVGIQWGDFYQDPYGNIGLKVRGKGAKPRMVKVPPEVWMLMRQHRRQQHLPDQLDAQDTSPLFMGEEGNHLNVRTLQKSIKAAAKAAGVKKSVSPHWMRHTSITLSLLGGAGVEQAQAMAGHSDLRTTSRYAHSVKQLRETAADFIRLDL